jgi:NADH:quinone reductase (non-electrogenic)
MTSQIIIIGGGFGGLTAARHLNTNNSKITLIDKTNHHLFQPLLYQVATAALSPGDIAVPIRSILGENKNIEVIMSEVKSIDKKNKLVHLHNEKLPFDFLIMAPGASHSYFGKNEWAKFAPGLKTLNDALSIRERVLISFEKAEIIENPKEKNKFLTFVIVGGGPTGVEMAGAIAEIAKKTMLKDFRNINTKETKVILVEAAPRLLTAYPHNLSEIAKKDLEHLGVKIITNQPVTNVTGNGVQLKDDFIETENIIWAAGNEASPLLKSLDVELDKAGRVKTEKDLTIKDHPEIFVIGDAAHAENENGELLPGIAPVAMQQAKYVAKLINKRIPSKNRKPFNYFDKGIMATIGKAKAVAKIRKMEFRGFIAWFLWSFIHIFFLITFKNRIKVMLEWIWYYFTSRRGVRLITHSENK